MPARRSKKLKEQEQGPAPNLTKAVRTGGKGTQRRKAPRRHRNYRDDAGCHHPMNFNTLNLQPLPQVQEVQILKDDGTALVLEGATMRFSLASNL